MKKRTALLLFPLVTTFASACAQVETTCAVGATSCFTYNATTNGMSPSGPPSNNTRPASSATSSIHALPVAANGTTTIVVNVRDAQGVPLANQAVTNLYSSGFGNTLGATSGMTDATGTWSTSITSTFSGIKLLSATVGTFTLTGFVNFTSTTPFCARTSAVTFNMVSAGNGNARNGSALGDLNGDGVQDLVITDQTGQIGVLIGNNAGTFNAEVDYAVGANPTMLVLGDFNKDGKLDVAVSNFYSATVSILLGSGGGRLQPAVTYAAGDRPWSIRPGDLNGDGKIDLVVANYGPSTVGVLIGAGDGTFAPMVQYRGAAGVNDAAVADFNNDGNLDVLTADYDASTASIMLGNGHGVLGAATSYSMGASKTPIAATVADFNRDGNADAVVVASNGNFVAVFLGNGDGTLQAMTAYATDASPNFAWVSDVNGDAIPDMVTPNHNADDISIFIGNGDGTFQNPITSPAGAGASSVVMGDLNGDGRPDYVTANFTDQNYSVGLSSGCSP